MTEFRDLDSKSCSMQYVDDTASVYTTDYSSNSSPSVYTTDYASNDLTNELNHPCFVPINNGSVSAIEDNRPPNKSEPILPKPTPLMDTARNSLLSVFPAKFRPISIPFLSEDPLPTEPTEPIQDSALYAKVNPEKPPIPVSPGIQILTTYDNSLLLSVSPSDTSIPVLKQFRDSKSWWPAPLPASNGFRIPETTYPPASFEIYNREADTDGDSGIDTPAESATIALAVFFQRSFAPLFLGTIPVDAQSLASEIVVGCPSSELCLDDFQSAAETGSVQPNLGYISPVLASFMARLISLAADDRIQLVPPSFPDSLLSPSFVPYSQKYDTLHSSLPWRRMSETVSALSNILHFYYPELASLLNPRSMCGISHLSWRKRLAAIYHLIHYALQYSPQVKAISTKSRFDWGYNPSPTFHLNSLLTGVEVLSKPNKNMQYTYQKQFSAKHHAKWLTLLSCADPNHLDLAPNEGGVDPTHLNLAPNDGGVDPNHLSLAPNDGDADIQTLEYIFNGSHLSVPVPLGRHPVTGDLFWFIQNFDFNKLISIDPDFSNKNPGVHPKMGASPFQLFRETNPSIEQTRNESLASTSDRKYWQLVASNTAELLDFCKDLQSESVRQAFRTEASMNSLPFAGPDVSYVLAHRLHTIHTVFAKMLTALKTILPRLELGETTREWELARREYLDNALGQKGANKLQKEMEKEESLEMAKKEEQDLGQGKEAWRLDIKQEIVEPSINQSIEELGMNQSVCIADPDLDATTESTDYLADTETTNGPVISPFGRRTRSSTNPNFSKKHTNTRLSPAPSKNSNRSRSRLPSSRRNTRSKAMQSSIQYLESNEIINLSDEEIKILKHDTSTKHAPSVVDLDSLGVPFTRRNTRKTRNSIQESNKRQTRQSRRFRNGRRDTDHTTNIYQDLESIATQDTEEVINLSDEEKRLGKHQDKKSPKQSVTETEPLPAYQEMPFPNSIGIAPIITSFQRSVERNQGFENPITRHERLWESGLGTIPDSPEPVDKPVASTYFSRTPTTRSNSFSDSQDDYVVVMRNSTPISKHDQLHSLSDDEYDGVGQPDDPSTTSRHYKRARLTEADQSEDPVEGVILIDSDDSSIVSPTLSANWSSNWFSSSVYDIPEHPPLLQYLSTNFDTSHNHVNKSGN